MGFHGTAMGLPWACFGFAMDSHVIPMPAMVLPWAFVALQWACHGPWGVS